MLTELSKLEVPTNANDCTTVAAAAAEIEFNLFFPLSCSKVFFFFCSRPKFISNNGKPLNKNIDGL